MVKRVSILILLLLGLAGCKHVQTDDLQGTWTMTEASRQVLPAALQKAIGKLNLNANGNFVMSDAPGLFYFPGRRDVRIESGNGTWKLISREGKRQVQLDFHMISDWKENDLPYGTQLEVSGRSSGTRLYYFIGDADEGKKVEFEKK